MIEIDSELSESDLLFHQRPMHAFMKLTEMIDPHGTFAFSKSKSLSDDDFSNDAISDQVNRWYENQYGDRIKIHMGPGSYVLNIKNEPWRVELPLCFGKINLTIDSNLTNVNRNVIIPTGEKIPSVNILCHVENMTQKIADSLSIQEREEILKDYMFGLNAVQHLRDMKKLPYMEQAMNDYDMAINNLFYKYPDYNNAKWSALQFTEKTIKSKLKLNNVPVKKNHNLAELAKDLEPLKIQISPILIQNIQCTAGVRYGESKVTKNEAVSSIKSSIMVYSEVFQASAFEMNRS